MSEPQSNYTPSDLRAGAADDAPVMSTPQTLAGIFFEPGRTFEALRARPRFLVAALIIAVTFSVYQVLLIQRIGGYEAFVRAQIEAAPRTADLPAEQKEQAIAMQTRPPFKAIGYLAPIIGVALFVAVGGALYLLGALLMGKGISYKQAVAVWVYSGLPPALVVLVANLLLLFLKSPDDMDIAGASRGLVHANLGLLVSGTAHPILATLLGSLDLFRLYGLFLAALGLRKVGRMSPGSAWTVVLLIFLLGVLLTVGIAAMTGTPMA
ncbi:MAG TPA: YIP1 family protein [Pyrinomonadaceae bacterium]|jgi:hypothetical protein